MKINIEYLRKILILLFLFFSLFLTNDLIGTFIKILFLSAWFLLFFVGKKNINKILSISIVAIITLFQLIITFFLSNNLVFEIINTTSILIVSYYEFSKESNININKALNIFLKVSIILFIIIIFANLINNFWNQGFLVFPNMRDKNYNAISVFFIFYACKRQKNILGIIISIITGYLLSCRLFIIGVIVVYIIDFFINTKIINKMSKMNTMHIFVLILLTNFIMIGLSYWMVENISISTITEHNESFNDDSNAMRVRSNVYAYEKIKENPMFLIYGYDSKIIEKLKVSKNYINPVFYKGFVLVQPHNLLLNSIIRYGVIYTILYLYIISSLMSKLNSQKNFPIIIVYIFMNLFMHSLLINSYLLMLMIILFSYRKEIKYEK